MTEQPSNPPTEPEAGQDDESNVHPKPDLDEDPER
jgi:hypothetical protein